LELHKTFWEKKTFIYIHIVYIPYQAFQNILPKKTFVKGPKNFLPARVSDLKVYII